VAADERRTAYLYLSLAAAAGVAESITQAAEMEFTPTDSDRTSVTRWLVEEFDWLGDAPLVVLHPGGGDTPAQMNHAKRWPAQRFARLANYLTRAYGVRVIVAGMTVERELAAQVMGMMSVPAANRAGQMSLGQLGALGELASLYVGNEAGSTYVAAATGCPTLAIYGPDDPGVNSPYMLRGRIQTLWQPYQGQFDWANGVSVDQAIAAADELLAAGVASGKRA
jgi:ADP-heptose:LPS heptosyltransferase